MQVITPALTGLRRVRNYFRLIVSGAALLGLFGAGCQSLPQGSPEIQQRALSFVPPEAKAGVYAVSARVPQVLVNLDNLPFGTIQSGYYLYGAVPPGNHNIAVLSGEGTGVGKFVAEAGKNYFFVIGNGWVAQKVTKQLSEGEGKKRVQKLKLSGDSHFEYDNELKPGVGGTSPIPKPAGR